MSKRPMKDLRTAQLWLQNIDMIRVLLTFIKAERTRDWQLHLQAVHGMLPYLAAATHNLYAKSFLIGSFLKKAKDIKITCEVCIQKILELAEWHPETYNNFIDGYQVVRRSDRYWGGLSTDLIRCL